VGVRSPGAFKVRLTEIQGDVCAWCLESLLKPHHPALLGAGAGAVVDHDHSACGHPVAKSRMGGRQGSNVACENCVRGLVHAACNRAIGHVQRFLAEGVVILTDPRLGNYLCTYPLGRTRR
jgi:Recombination endonuclease VII